MEGRAAFSVLNAAKNNAAEVEAIAATANFLTKDIVERDTGVILSLSRLQVGDETKIGKLSDSIRGWKAQSIIGWTGRWRSVYKRA